MLKFKGRRTRAVAVYIGVLNRMFWPAAVGGFASSVDRDPPRPRDTPFAVGAGLRALSRDLRGGSAIPALASMFRG